MAHLLVLDGEDSLQIWRVAANVVNKQLWTVDKGWPSSLGVGWGAINPPTIKTPCYEMFYTA
jgi:hypothetical protein